MKTKNNVQKAILKSLAVITSLVIISITVNAQGLWKSLLENYNFKEIELAMVDNNTIALHVEYEVKGFEFILVPETEEALELEKWMTDANNFEVSTLRFIEETDTELKIEDWMLKEEFFTSNLEIDQPLELETWMVSEKIW